MRAYPSGNRLTNDVDHGFANFIDDLMTLAGLQASLTVGDATHRKRLRFVLG